MRYESEPFREPGRYPVQLHLEPQQGERNRLTTAFRLILAFPHLLIVGGPIGLTLSWSSADNGTSYDSGAGGGVLGVVAGLGAVIAWFAIVFTGRHPQGLWDLAAFYMRWRVRAVAYTALLRDEYPPFGEGVYPVRFEVQPPSGPRDRVRVGFRIFLALPQLLAVWALGLAWAVSTIVAWFAILFTGRYPASLYEFGVGVLRWNTRVEAYLLLMTDTYPPFSLEA